MLGGNLERTEHRSTAVAARSRRPPLPSSTLEHSTQSKSSGAFPPEASRNFVSRVFFYPGPKGFLGVLLNSKYFSWYFFCGFVQNITAILTTTIATTTTPTTNSNNNDKTTNVMSSFQLSTAVKLNKESWLQGWRSLSELDSNTSVWIHQEASLQVTCVESHWSP